MCGFGSAATRRHRRILCGRDARSITSTLDPVISDHWADEFAEKEEPLAEVAGGSVVVAAGVLLAWQVSLVGRGVGIPTAVVAFVILVAHVSSLYSVV